ncbi:MAG: hypothetical protein J6330_04070 [Clostridia bacterium]|nr:hypothetical protein [Clostridia bacterium]
MDYSKYNERAFECMSMYLNLAPHFINERMYKNTGGDELAYSALLASVCMLDTVNDPDDKILYRDYFIPMVHRLDPAQFEADPYFRNISFDEKVCGDWKLSHMKCSAYEAFVCGDPVVYPNGKILPQIGYFERDYEYPAVLQRGREWMTLMPNETATIRPHVIKAGGNVLTFGLGLGYFAYLAALKPDVERVTAVELDADVIRLFCENVLPQMQCRDKIEIVQADAFEFAEKNLPGDFDFVFTDIWHDPSDGVEPYLRMKKIEEKTPSVRFSYWIEDTLRLYI